MASPVRRRGPRSASRPPLAPWAAVGAPPERTRAAGLLAVADDVHGGFLGRGGPAVDALVPGQQSGLGVGRVAPVAALEPAGPPRAGARGRARPAPPALGPAPRAVGGGGARPPPPRAGLFPGGRGAGRPA